MASPITVTTTPIILVVRNNNRDRLILQNEGKLPVYVKRQKTNAITDIPSDTNFDFVLYGPQGAEASNITQINSVATYAAAIVASGENKSSNVSVLETVKTNIY